MKEERMAETPRWQELVDELTALEQEREPLQAAKVRAELLAEQAQSYRDALRERWEVASADCRVTAATVQDAARALARHDQALAEVRRELASCAGVTRPLVRPRELPLVGAAIPTRKDRLCT
jgi:hypothetical protein